MLRDGVHRFTLDAVAAEAGISKGGLVYSFSSKDQLIMTMLSRELARFELEAQQQTARYANQPHADVLGHITAIGQEEDETTSRAVGLLTALVHSPPCWNPCGNFIAPDWIDYVKPRRPCSVSVWRFSPQKAFFCYRDWAS
nr:TetR/AcrR family transcriptional regulator [Pectobacterium sp. PL152]